jgi:hypothetical protein
LTPGIILRAFEKFCPTFMTYIYMTYIICHILLLFLIVQERIYFLAQLFLFYVSPMTKLYIKSMKAIIFLFSNLVGGKA